MHALRIALAGILLPAFAASAQADQVILKNGDIISGRVVNKSGDILTVNTTYAGDIKINWKDVSTLSTDKQMPTLLGNDDYLKTSILPADSGNVRLSGKDADTPKDAIDNQVYGLNDILYINPTPEESGRGYRYSGRANLALSNTSGNSNNQMLHLDGEVQKRARDYRITLGGEANRSEDNNIRSASNSRLYTSYDSFYTKSNFVYVRGALENDRFKDIKLRSLVGVGYGYQIFETEKTRLSVRGGPDYVNVDRYIAESESFPALGWNVDFLHQLTYFPTMPMEIFHVQDGYRGFNSEGDILLKTRTGLRIPLNKGFVATIQYNLDWEKNPAPGRKSFDRQLLIGLGYAFQ
jgi:putative salt-induced outer membrane protein YdiY